MCPPGAKVRWELRMVGWAGVGWGGLGWAGVGWVAVARHHLCAASVHPCPLACDRILFSTVLPCMTVCIRCHWEYRPCTPEIYDDPHLQK